MNYYYDIVLNFLEENTQFYEWDENDSIEYIKKIPLFHLKTENFLDFLNYKVKVNQNFLQEIKDKTIKKNDKLKYACLLADKNSAYAFEFDDEGFVISRSSLILIDELNLLDYLYTVSIKDINYEKISKTSYRKDIRQNERIRNFINLEINKLYKEKKEDKLKYLYLELFNKKEKSLDKVYQDMKSRIDKDIDEDVLRIYDLIKISYNNV